MAAFKVRGTEYQFKVDGRGTSVLGSGQGDHVTSYALIKKGFSRALLGLELEGVENLSDLRDGRGIIYDYISTVAVLDGDNRNSLYESVNRTLDGYNERRFKQNFVQAVEALPDATLRDKNLRKIYISNGHAICDSFREMAESTLTFFNHIPQTSFLRIDTYKAPGEESQKIKSALKYFDKEGDEEVESLRKEIEQLSIQPVSGTRSSTRVMAQSSKQLQEKRQELDQLTRP